MTTTALSKISPSIEFWRGTKFRLVQNNGNIGINEPYYDYILTLLPWEKKYMLLVNITENNSETGASNYKAGAVYGSMVPISPIAGKIVVTIKEIQQAFGKDFENLYLIDE